MRRRGLLPVRPGGAVSRRPREGATHKEGAVRRGLREDETLEAGVVRRLLREDELHKEGRSVACRAKT